MEKKNITIRMTEDMHKSLKELADRDHRTMSSYVELVLMKHIEKQNK